MSAQVYKYTDIPVTESLEGPFSFVSKLIVAIKSLKANIVGFLKLYTIGTLLPRSKLNNSSLSYHLIHVAKIR